MKERKINILNYIIENQGAKLDDLCQRFNISKRTLYYDIKDINEKIKISGEVKNVKGVFHFIGNYDLLYEFFEKEKKNENFEPVVRQKYILKKLITGNYNSIEKLADELQISKNTCVSDIHEIRSFLNENSLKLQYSNDVAITGREFDIRNIFIILFSESREMAGKVSKEVTDFNNQYNLQLTDCSLELLTSFLSFVRNRISQGIFVEDRNIFDEAKKFPFYNSIQGLLGEENEREQKYLAAFISALPSRRESINNDIVKKYINELIKKIEKKTALVIDNKNEFQKNLQSHLLSSYYRIKFHFPLISNLDLTNISYDPLYRIVNLIIIECAIDFPEFSNMRREEIYFITAYFGAYLSKSRRENNFYWNKVLLVCPNGLTVSKTLQIEINRYIPVVDIVDSIPISEIDNYSGYYNYIISTVPINKYKNVIVVHPLLTKLDILNIMNHLFGFFGVESSFNIESLLQVIRKNAVIVDKKSLINDLEAAIYQNIERNDDNTTMLKDLISEEKINIIDSVGSWQEAIAFAAKPLLDDRSIEKSYIDAMIESVYEFGAYIVLDDYFALPHAKSTTGVNRLAMALLVVKENVDLLGNPVNVFLVVATPDNTSHLEALASLSDILCKRKNIDIFRKGTKNQIINLINSY